MQPVIIEIPFPPSVNSLFANAKRSDGRRSGGRFPTKRYQAWRREAELMIMAARPKSVTGPVAVSMVLHPFNDRRMDADNTWKATLDSLVRMGVIEADDSRIVRKATVEWGSKRAPAAAVVTITPLG